jgi:hypothetical protein
MFLLQYSIGIALILEDEKHACLKVRVSRLVEKDERFPILSGISCWRIRIGRVQYNDVAILLSFEDIAQCVVNILLTLHIEYSLVFGC